MMLVLASHTALGATLEGNIYDIELNLQTSVLVTIDSVPIQKQVVQTGNYAFDVPPGTYTLEARKIHAGTIVSKTVETVAMPQDGRYIRDLILFPADTFDELSLNDSGLQEISELNLSTPFPSIAVLLIGLSVSMVLVVVLVVIQRRSRHNQSYVPDKHATAILTYLSGEGGRTTQKNIRREVPLSEAKVSLLLAELEQHGYISKIKKGRSNIIIKK